MTRKIITGVIAAVLVVTIVVLAAEKAKEKVRACEQPALSKVEGFGLHERLLDQLAEAYKANDREKMGEIINRMQERREKMREFVRFNRWQRWAHRRMMGQMGPGWGQGPQMAGPGFNQGFAMNGPCGNCGWAMRGPCGNNWGCPMAGPRWEQFQAMRRGFGGCNNMMGNCGAFAGPQYEVTKGWGCGPGFFNGMGNCGPIAGGFGQMPCQQGGMSNCMPQQGGPMQMRGWERGGFQKQWTPGPGAENMGQQEWNMPRRERQTNVPPPEWGW
ncbi:MAG: hypothetical protein ABSB25_08570 [Sedimentisphaerales bacterium]|jgi:hypothetical protein